MPKILKFPPDFLWGASTSAHQVEGGNRNDWSEWEKSEGRRKKLEESGLNPEDFISGKACDSYNRYEEDFDLCVAMNNNVHRLGADWARIMPEKGKIDTKEIEHYRKVFEALKKRKLKIVFTLWHWPFPLWISSRGGWTNKKTIKYFARYADVMSREFGEYVDYWVTLNEPMIHAGHGYIDGKFPPHKKNDYIGAMRVISNLICAHKESYKIIKKNCPGAQIGITMVTGYFEPNIKWHLMDVVAAKIGNYFRNNWFQGRVKGYFDFIGVNYYHHVRLSCIPPFVRNENKLVSDFGWEIYPEGIYHVLKGYAKYKKPILILENGVADAKDQYRKDFIVDHLKWVHKAISEGVDVRGYFHWSLLDNFEWADGYGMKFGLHAVDRKTFKRTPRPSAKVYAEICERNGVEIN
ncbi:MAG: glycoside hydrolase family 1 protein [Patescibacteria group bacterium]|jgi:beta-glucosidase